MGRLSLSQLLILQKLRNIFEDFMKIKNPKVSYDRKAKILSIRLAKTRSVDSDVRGNVVFDYDAEGDLVNVDIMRVSLSEFGRTSALRTFVRMSRHATA